MSSKAISSYPEYVTDPEDNLADPEFPPAFCGITVSHGTSPIEDALNGVVAGRFGAGDICWSHRIDRAEAAFVLEPDVELAKALQMVPLLMVAIGDALGAIGPPNLALTFRWPNRILANGADVCRVQAAVYPDCSPGEVPRFLLVAFDLALFAGNGNEPGHDLRTTYLYEEGCGDLDRTILIEAVARHFLSGIDGWQSDGFRTAHQSWTGRLHEKGAEQAFRGSRETVSGTVLGIDEDAGLLLRTEAGPRALSLEDFVIERAGEDA
jgi:BirA family biotin operon repressor/biotin-[acetyl-CoA-carboxylase] ligase